MVRSNNPPAGDYAEWLVAKAFSAALAPASEKSYDLKFPDGRRVQVKSRVVSSPPVADQVQSSPFRSWDFEVAAFVLLDAVEYRPVLGVLAPVDVVREHAKPRPHVNGEIVFIRPPLTKAPGTTDVTAALVKASRTD